MRVIVLRLAGRRNDRSMTSAPKPFWINIAAFFGVFFGGVTLYSGGSVLFIDGPAREAAGNYVPFVLWFNFLAGFAYIFTGIGLFLWRRWAVQLSALIAVSTLLIYVLFAVHIMTGGSYELRTIGAMSLRSFVWLLIAFLSYVVWNKHVDWKLSQ